MSLRLITFFILLIILAAYDFMAFSPAGCTNPGLNQINISYGPSKIHVTPHRKNVYAGDTLRFNLIGPGGKTITVAPKSALNSWPDMSSSSSFEVCVPAGTPSGDYGYEVKVPGVGYLDPVVRIL